MSEEEKKEEIIYEGSDNLTKKQILEGFDFIRNEFDWEKDFFDEDALE